MATTLEIQEKLNKLLEDAEKIAENLSRQYREQANLLEKIAESTAKISGSSQQTQGVDLNEYYREVADSAEEARTSISSAMEEASEKTSKASESSKKLDSSVQQTSKSMKLMEGASAVIGGIGKAFSFAGSAAVGFMSMLGSIGSGVFSVAKAVIGFPFQMLNGLIGMASGGGGSSELAEALREIQVEFGYLDKTAGGAIVNLSKNMSGELANTGLRVSRVFGNLAERLKYFTEYAKNLGETVDAVFNTLKASSAEALGAYNKALGFTAAGQKGVAQRALATGQDINEINRQVANFALQLSSSFGVTMKLVSRDVGEMMADFEHFGSLSVQEMTQASVFARKLGIEVKSLGKLVDKFLNFEDAANSAAQLSQAFGINVDAFKLMSEQDPAKKMQMLRDSFFAAGKTIENMTAQERRLLATQTGLSESELSLAFSQKSRGLSYDQIKKKGDAAQKSQLSQEQVLDKLSGAIERLVKSGSAMQGGFFDRFMQGFVQGTQQTKEFKELMRALSRSLAIVFRAGVAVGRMFVDLFPGIKDILQGLTKVFNPGIMLTFMTRIKSAFREFVQLMTTNPSTALPILLQRLKDAFLERFTAAGPGGLQILDGIKKFFKTIGFIALEGLKLATATLADELPGLLRTAFNFLAELDIMGLYKKLQENSIKLFSALTSSESLREILSNVKRLLSNLASYFINEFPGIATKILDSASTAFGNIFDILSDEVGKLTENLVSDKNINTMAEKFSTGATLIFEKLKEKFPVLVEKLKNLFLKLIDSAIIFFKTIPNKIADLFNQNQDAIKEAGIRFGYVLMNAIVGIAAFLGKTLLKVIVNLPDIISALGRMIGSVFRAVVGFISGAITGIGQSIAATFPSIAEPIQTIFNGLASAFQGIGNFILSIWNTVVNALAAGIRAFVNLLPDRLKTMLGLGGPARAAPPAQQNPIVQTINQAVGASRTGAAAINTNLTNALNVPRPAAAAAAPARTTEQSLPERVESIRSSITAAQEIRRLDPARAQEAFAKMRQFAEQLGPTLTQTQTAFNTAFGNIDINKINQTTNSIYEILGKVSGIQQALSQRNSRQVATEQFQPLNNSITAIKNFLTSEGFVALSTQLSAAEVSTRVVGIETTANAISQMVEKINATSQELARLQPVNIQSNLSRLATNLGLGNNATYTIQNRNFTVTVNVDVHMDARELENTLIERRGTRIQHTPAT
jgi:hypothetical protein